MPPNKIRSYPELSERIADLAGTVEGVELRLLGKVRSGPTLYPFWALTTPNEPGRKRVCLSGGIHGDEPAGVEGVLGALETLRKEPALIERFHFTFFPCINPFGYEHHTRENGSKIDLNRRFIRKRPPSEVRFVKEFLEGKRFDVSIEFHEDIDTPGFYLYELCDIPGGAVGAEIIRQVAERYPVNLRDEIEGAPAKGGIISPDLASPFFKKRIERRRQWPQAIYLYKQGVPHTITSETPVHLDMRDRARMHLIVLKTALEGLEKRR